MEALTSAQKAAIIISSIGTENASEVFKHFSDEEVEQITLEIARMNYYPMEVVDSVLNEFYELCLTQKVISEGGVEYARDILEKAFGPQTAQALFEKITKQFQTKAFAFVRKADYKNLLAMVQNEHPQTIALILSYARSDQASAILSELPKKTRIDVVERMAKMDRASPDVVKSIERTLEKKFDNLVTADTTEVGGIDYVAEVMNNVDRATEKIHIRRADAERSEAGRRYTLKDVRIRGYSNSRQYGYTGVYTGGRFKGSCGCYQGLYSRGCRVHLCKYVYPYA